MKRCVREEENKFDPTWPHVEVDDGQVTIVTVNDRFSFWVSDREFAERLGHMFVDFAESAVERYIDEHKYDSWGADT